MNKLLMDKILPILSVFLLSIFVLCTSSFAATEIYNKDLDYSFYFPDWMDDYVVQFFPYRNGEGYSGYVLILSTNGTYWRNINDKAIRFYPNEGGKLVYCTAPSIGSSFDVNNINNRLKNISKPSSEIILEYNNLEYYNYGRSISFMEENAYYVSGVDLLDENGNVVFQVAPQSSQLTQIVEQEKETMEGVTQEIVAIIPVVLVVVVVLIAIRKAITFLKMILTRA